MENSFRPSGLYNIAEPGMGYLSECVSFFGQIGRDGKENGNNDDNRTI